MPRPIPRRLCRRRISRQSATGAAAHAVAGRRLRGTSSGALVVLGEPPATEFERLAPTRIVALLALELARDLARGRRERRTPGRADALPGDGPPWVALMARQLVAGAPTELGDREHLRARIARLAPARRLRLRGDAGSLELRVIVVATTADPLGLAMAGEVAASGIGRSPSRARSTGPTIDHWPSRRPSHPRSRRQPASRLSPRLSRTGRSPGGVQVAGQPAQPARRRPQRNGPAGTHPHRASSHGRRAPGDPAGGPRAARPLRGGPRPGHPSQHTGLPDPSIETVTGWRLEDPDVRFALALAVRLVQNAQDSW